MLGNYAPKECVGMNKAKAFLQERIIYEYMEYRANQGNLVMYQVMQNGALKGKKTKVYVPKLDPIETSFPDINWMNIKDEKGKNYGRPAEIKFISSEFNYHKDKTYADSYLKFKNEKGCLIVLKHDTTPNGLLTDYNIDIYELDYQDFVSFVYENFHRLLHKQLINREGDSLKYWIMSQTTNFYKNYKTYPVRPANESHIWCPTDNLSSYDLAKKDKIIFIKFGGKFQIKQDVQSAWRNYHDIDSNWILQQLWVGEITVPIMNRKEYCDLQGINFSEPLWNDEVKSNKKWPRVFQFKKERVINCNIKLKELHTKIKDIVHPVFFEVFTQQNSREISPDQYIKLLEVISEELTHKITLEEELRTDLLNLINVSKDNLDNTSFVINHLIHNLDDITRNITQ
jgi:hypothetical protein